MLQHPPAQVHPFVISEEMVDISDLEEICPEIEAQTLLEEIVILKREQDHGQGDAEVTRKFPPVTI